MGRQYEFLAFMAVGGSAALVNMGARVVIGWATSYALSILLAYIAGLLTAFLLNRIFVFRAAGTDWHGHLVRFALVNVVSFTQVFLVTLLFAWKVFPAIGMNFHSETIAHAIGVASPTFTSYWLHRHYTFSGAIGRSGA